MAEPVRNVVKFRPCPREVIRGFNVRTQCVLREGHSGQCRAFSDEEFALKNWSSR